MKRNKWIGDHLVRIWDVGTKKQVREFGTDLYNVDALAFSPDGSTLATGSFPHGPPAHGITSLQQRAPESAGASLRLWNPVDGRELANRGVCGPCVNSVCFSPDGSTIACGYIDIRRELASTIRLFDAKDVQELVGPQDEFVVQSLKFSPDGRLLFAAAEGLRIWEMGSNKLLAHYRDEELWSISSIDISPDGIKLACGCSGQIENGHYGDCFVVIVDPNSGTTLQKFRHRTTPSQVAFCGGGSVLAAGDGGEMHLWQLN